MALYEEFERRPNRLIDAESRYLRDAAYQPVGWFEFGPEAFAEAKRMDKPIFLDIGAAWCHWCHVIDRESYENPAIATLINEHFIPIKVDRDERPDIDARYQTAVQLLSKQGGWPLTVFLTPDGEPFFGGTYFPPEDAGGVVGLTKLLPRVADAYRHRRREIREVADAMMIRTRRSELRAAGNGVVDDETFAHVAQGIKLRYNQDEGGFEVGAPKFPHAGAIEVALLQYDLTGDASWRAMIDKTLTAMGRGGIYDQLEGGFHRYAVDANWTVPHFEKMSFDNAVLLENYVHAYRATGDTFFLRIANGTLDFILSVLADHDRGGFFASQDADNTPQDDGSYWTWTEEEFVAALTPHETPILTRYYGVSPEGNVPHSDRNVLHIAETPEEIAAALGFSLEEVQQRIENGTRKLAQARRRRHAPRVDTGKYVNWNALLVSACLEAGALLGRDDARDFALRTVDVILHDGYEPEHGAYHAFHQHDGASLPGFFEDQAYLARALLDAFQVSGNRAYPEAAQHLLDLCIAQYWDEEEGGFFDIARFRQAEEGVVFLRQPRKVIEDMPSPAANAVAALTLDRLWVLTHDDRYHEYAGRTLEAFAEHAPGYGPYAAHFGMAVFFHLHPPATAVIIGDPGSEATNSLWQAALNTYRPGRLVAVYPAEALGLAYPLPAKGEVIAYVCAGRACAESTSDQGKLQQTLRTFGKPEPGLGE